MANRIAGITIELNGDTTKLTKALSGVDKSLKNTETQLKDVDKLLKLDPRNTELLKQKQELLSKAVADTKEKLEQEKAALEQLQNAPNASETIDQQNALKREIIATEASLKSYETELQKSGVSLQQISQISGEVAQKTKALSAAAAAFGAAMIGNAVNAGKASDELLTLSRNTGMSVEELQKMEYASELVDVSIDQMTGSLKKLTMKMSSGSDVFDQLGVSIYDANGEMRNVTDVWYDSLKALSQVENETERDAMAMELFGKSAMDLSGIIDDGGEALRKYGEEAEDAGLIMSKEAAQDAAKLNDEIDKLKSTFKMSMTQMGASLAKQLLPALQKLVDKVSKILSWFSNLNGTTQKTILIIAGLVAAISPVAGIISKITSMVSGLSSAFTFLTGPVGLVVAAIAAAIAIGVTLYKNWDTIKAKAQELGQGIANVWNNVKAKTSEVWNNVSSAVSSAVNNVKNNAVNGFNNVRDSISNALNNARSTVSTIFSGISSTVSNVVSNIKSVFSTVTYALTHPFETARNTIQGIVDRIKGVFNFSWSLPHISLPHFRVSGGKWPYGLGGQGWLPSISIDWYAKAMKDGIIMSSPTIFGMNNGTLLGGGEAGSETIVGTNSLMKMIQSAVGSASPTVNMTINASDQNVYQLADLVIDRLVQQTTRNGVVFK